MKKTMRGAKRIFVTMLAVMLVMESVSVPAKGEVQTESISEQTLGESVDKYAEESVSANFVPEEKTEVSSNTVNMEVEKADQERTVGNRSGIDGDLEWSIDAEGCLTVRGQGDYEKTPDWLDYKEEIKCAKISVQNITSMKEFFKYCYYLEEVDFKGTNTSQVTDMSGMFYCCTNLGSVEIKGFDTTKVTTMKSMFASCKNLSDIGIDGIKTGSVTEMNSMFAYCTSLKEIDISHFDMSQVSDLGGLFLGCSSLEKVNLGKPDTSKVTDMGRMFDGCKLLEEIDVSELETSNVTNMSYMFSECESVTELDLSTFDFSKVNKTDRMFYNCIALETLDLGDTKLESLYITKEMFRGCKELQEIDLTKFDTTNVYDMEGMFMDCHKVKELDVRHFNTEKVQSFSCLFNGCESVKELDVTGFKTDKVTDMSWMFYNCMSVKKLDVSGFDTTGVTDMTRMFSGCSSLVDFKFGEDKNVEQVSSISYMFERCKSLKTLKIDLYLPEVTRMDYFFKDCNSLTSTKDIDISAFYLKSAKGMFQGCSSLVDESESLGSLYLEDISYMYKDCTSLKYLSLSFLNAYRLTNIDEVCAGCSSLESVFFPRGDAEKLERMHGIFEGCSSLKGVDLTGFNTPYVTSLSDLFYKCSSLKSVKMEVLDSNRSTVTSMSRMFEGCSSLQGIDLSGFEPKQNSFIRDNFKDCTSLIEIDVSPSMMQCLTASKYHNFDGCELFSEFHLSGTSAEWAEIRPLWQNCPEKKVKYASVHLNDGTIEQTLQHAGSFKYIKQGGFGTQDMADYVYNCDLSQFFGSSYNYNHSLARMSIRVSMAAMSDNTNLNSSNIVALMDDLNVTKRKISYPKSEYNTIGYAMGARRIYHNNQKKTLIMVAIRGSGYGAEWGGNANVGNGVEHEGFERAANQVYWALNDYIGELKACNFIEGKDVVVWISGYSRGGATTNLLAAKLDDRYYLRAEPPKNAKGEVPEEHIMDVQPSNVFAYCFECPQNTTNSYNNQSRYMNIYNIINPKDFVTYVAMNNGWDWRFNRYGKDLVLPDEANTKGSDYAGYFANMKNVYQAGIVPEIGANQSTLVKDAAKELANVICYSTYTIALQANVQVIACKIMAKNFDWHKFIEGILTINYSAYDLCDVQMIPILGKFAVLNSGIMYAHYPELCMAWMDSIPEEILLKQKSYRNIYVNCPVDIYVYEDKNLVGCIKNDVPQQIENGVITMMDSNGQKQVVLPGDGEYRVVCKATGDGAMTISTSKYIQTETIPESVTAYYELPLKSGDTYEAMVTGADFALSDSAKTTVKPSAVQNGADVKTYKVDITVEGDGEASGINTYAVGEFAKVFAYPKDGEKFLGWYENGNLISSEAEYRFCVKKDTTLIAKFTQNTKTSKKEEQSVAVGKLYKVNKHTYKVTSVKKKTVSFVKTSSKSKTIKIPATVSIKGKKYKVTAIAANALKGNKKVTKITIGKNVTSIGKKAFYKCTALKTITIPSKVKTIGESAFSGCKKLTKATIGKGVTKIGKKAFYNCKKLKSVTIKTTKLKTVGKYAFKGIAKQATIKCPAKKLKKYKKILKKSKMAKTVQVK